MKIKDAVEVLDLYALNAEIDEFSIHKLLSVEKEELDEALELLSSIQLAAPVYPISSIIKAAYEHGMCIGYLLRSDDGI